ncbi:DsbA family protein [Aliikangiella maris]|uniref:DsbA family protein n=2 Tax=Aliikangiella maris TaxID=3162458 RepID=A0ABV2BUF4_9GAMM
MKQCDTQTGCALPDSPNNISNESNSDISSQVNRESLNQVDIVFVTDPICSHCWAIEPAWRRLQLTFEFKTRYIHGGLLPGWQGFSDAANGISKPIDVIPHWQHVTKVSGQPIDPGMWADDPIDNSYILCRAAIAVRCIKPESESLFLRKMREAVLLKAQNATRPEILKSLAEQAGISAELFSEALQSIKVETIFLQERQEMLNLGARGFPSFIFLGKTVDKLVGMQSFEHLANRLLSHKKNKLVSRNLSDKQKLQSFDCWTLTEAAEVLQVNKTAAKPRLIDCGFVKSDFAGEDVWILSE